MGVGKAMAGDARRRPVSSKRSMAISAGLRAHADHHDGDGGIVAHAVSGIGRLAGCRAISTHVNAHGAPTRAMWTDLTVQSDPAQ